MKSMTKRLLTAAVALPLLFIIIFLLPQMNHIVLECVIVLAALIGTWEMVQIVSKKGRVSRICYLGALLPLVEWFMRTYNFGTEWTFYSLLGIIGLLIAAEVFQGAKDNFETSIDTIGRSVLSTVYPGLFAIFITDLLFTAHPTAYLLLYFAIVMGADTFAFFSGVAFGKNNKGLVKVSPNKSLAGFIGGTIIPAIIGAAAFAIWPSIFAMPWWQGAILGFLTACLAALGDLVESTLKRCSGVKDSGIVIPGRGGMLDSIDSILFAAAPFIICINVLALI